MPKVKSYLYFAVAAFLMDGLGNLALLNDAFFAHNAFHANQVQQGALGFLNATGYAVGCLFFGPWSERTGRRRMVCAAVAGNIVLLLAVTRCESLDGLIGLATARKFVLAMFWPALMAWIADASSPRSFAADLCAFNVGWTLGAGGGSWLAGHIGQWAASQPGGYDPQVPYLVAAGVGVILLGWFLVVEPRPSEVIFAVSEDLDPRLANRLLKLAWISNATVYATISIVIYMLPRLAELPVLSISEGAQSSVHAIRSVAGLVLFGAMLANRGWHGRTYPFALCLLACLSGMLLMGSARSPLGVIVGGACLGAALGGSYTMSLFYSLSVPRVKGRGSAAHEGLIGMGYALGPLVGGLAAFLWMTPRAPFFAGACMVLAVFFACTLLPNKKTTTDTAQHCGDSK